MISVLRIFLAPVLVLLVLSEDDTAASIAAAVFVFGAFTDGLDGWLARRYSNSTTIGQWLDPLADKILVSAPLIAMAFTGEFPAWATIVIVGRELAVSLLRARLGTRGVSMPASPWGKAKTAVQMVLVPLYLLPLGAGAETARRIVLALAVALTIWSGLDYFLGAGRRTRTTEPQ
jgi:CDP-diacylglycerol--glycerol-3-phosphate 3-phosphatidyltransferase